MAKQTKKLIQFIGFLLSVWIFGRGANAAVSSEDLSANSKSNSIKQIDSAKFAQTGEVASRDNRAYMFAYVCEGVYWNDAPWTDCSGSEKVYNVPGCKDKNKGDKVDYHYTDNQGNPQVSKDVLCSFGVKYWYPATVGQDCPEFFRGVSG